MPSDRAVSSSATRIGRALVHERVGGEQLRVREHDHAVRGPDVEQLRLAHRLPRPRVGIVGRDQRHLRPHACRLRLAVRERRAVAGRGARSRRAGRSRARARCPPGTPGASLRTRAGCASPRGGRAPSARRPPAAPGPFASAPAIRVTPVSPAAIRVATASSARSGLSPPVGRERSRSRAHRQPERLGDRAGDVVVAPRPDPHHLDRAHGTRARCSRCRRPRRAPASRISARASRALFAIDGLADTDDHRETRHGSRHASGELLAQVALEHLAARVRAAARRRPRAVPGSSGG